jgi:hypothetical protein
VASSENEHHNPEQRVTGFLEVRSVGCKSRFCARCSVNLGLVLRERLKRVLPTFRGLQMWTLTIDPTLFASPKAAYVYVRDRRCVSELVRQLHRWGHLFSPRYFVVVEWQERTEMVHFHLLLDAGFVPIEDVKKAWGRFRPGDAGPASANRPEFGLVRFTRSWEHLRGTQHAANYVCAYLIKQPEHGYPAWVLDAEDIEVHRYSTSRGFWDEAPEARAEPEEDDDDLDDPSITSIRRRVARCGKRAVLLRVDVLIDLETGEQYQRRRWAAAVPDEYAVFANRLGRGFDPSIERSFVVSQDEWRGLGLRLPDGS